MENFVKNIWIFNHYAKPSRYGGITRHLDFARELVKRGYSVTIFCSDQVHLTTEKIEQSVFTEDGVRFRVIKTIPYRGNGVTRLWNMMSYFIGLIVIGIRESEKPDTIYSSSPHLLATLAGVWISKLKSAKSVVEIRDLWPETFIQYDIIDRNSFIAKTLSCLENYCYKKSDEIIVTAPGMKNYIAEKTTQCHKVSYINNGLDIEAYEQFKSEKHSIQEILMLDSSKFNVVYAGNHGMANGLNQLMEVCKRVKELNYDDVIQFTFVGDGPHRDNLIKRCSEENLKNVYFHSGIDKKYMPSLYELSDTLILAIENIELYDKYGISINKVFEYLYSGKPVVFLGDPYNDIVSESKGGVSIRYVENYIDAFTNELIQIYEGDVERFDFDKSQKYIIENYSVKRLVDQLETKL